ncbi:MAG TPA: J domain-containing protein [Kofleriaceae bacterium]|nr:J domain-containing protein [Kofleriaceae bacterium]
MAIVARGAVADRPWARTFAFVAGRAFNGELVLTAEGKRYVVGWSGGAIVSAASPLPSDAVARIAMTAQLISPSQVGDIMRVQAAAPNRDEVDVIVEAVKLTPELAARLRRRAVAARAMRTFAITAGDFVLDDAPTLPQHPELAIDARALAFAGAKQHFTDARLLEELAALGLVYRLRDDAVAELGQYGFTESERPALQVLRERAVSPHELETACPDCEPKAVRAMLYVLACFGAVEVTGSAAPRRTITQPPPTRAPTPPPIPPIPPAPSVRMKPASEPPRAKPASEPPRAKPTTTVPPIARTTIPPAVTAPPPAHSPLTQTGDWSEASSPAIRRRGKIRSSAPPNTTARAGADAVRSLVAERLQLLERGADHFALLGVDPDAQPEDVRDAYFALARQLHPDRLAAIGVSDERREAQRLFAVINNAFAVLSNPKKRTEYLGLLREGGAAVAAAKQDQAEELASKIFAAEDHFRKGEMALRRDQLDAAHIQFQEAVRLNPNEGEHHALLAWTTYATAPDKAKVRIDVKKRLEEAIKQAPRSPTPFLYLGRIARIEGHDQEAIQHFEKVMKMMPGHSEAASELRVLESRRAAKPTKPPEEKKGLFGFIKKP